MGVHAKGLGRGAIPIMALQELHPSSGITVSFVTVGGEWCESLRVSAKHSRQRFGEGL